MGGPVEVPNLGEKLDVLYRRDTNIHIHKELAKALSLEEDRDQELAPGNISIWIHGSQNSLRGSELVPSIHISPLCRIFNIRESWLTDIKDMQEFKVLLDHSPLNRSPWEELTLRADISADIQLVRKELFDQRGFILPDERMDRIPDIDSPYEQFYLGEEIYIEFKLNRQWAKRVDQNTAHLTLLAEDYRETSCLCPADSSFVPKSQLEIPIVCIPERITKEFIQVDGPIGVQTIFALLTAEPLPPKIYDDLRYDNVLSILNEMALHLNRREIGTWELFKRTYEVYRKSTPVGA